MSMRGQGSGQRTQGGMGFCSALGLLFIALKLLHQIEWSWWWVLSPLWIPVVLLAVGILIALAVLAYKDARRRRRAGVKL